MEEEEHAVSLDRNRQAHDPQRVAAGAEASRLANDDRAAGHEALQHFLHLEHVVRRGHVSRWRRLGRDDLAEDDDG